jgi:putative Holliday junction resolvase
MRYLGVDLGERRTGLAVSDPQGRVALSHSVVTHRSQAEQLRLVYEVVRQIGVDVVVVGRPTGLSGRAGPSDRRAVRFAGRLSNRSIRVILWDERFTTRQAKEVLREGGLDERKGRRVVDQLAATLILQSYLDYINSR